MLRTVLLLVALLPGTALAQSLAGMWVYQGPAGEVRLAVQQNGAVVGGTMTAADGTAFLLEGALEDGGATGSIRIGDGGGWFGMGLVGSQLKLVVAEIDPATGQPDLNSGWELDFTRTGAAAGPAPSAGAAPGGPGFPSRPSRGGTPTRAEASPLVREWLGHLRGKKLSYRESYNSDGVGGSGGYSNNWDAWLCSDGSFHFQQSSSTSIDTGGVFGGARSGNATRGTWRVVEYNGQAVLQYQMEGSAPEYGVLGFRDGATWLDDSRIYVTEDNPYCG